MLDHNVNTENYLFNVASIINIYENVIQNENESKDSKDQNKEEPKTDTGYSALGMVNLFYKLNLFN